MHDEMVSSNKPYTHLTALNKHIDEAEKLGLTSFYIEIIVKEGFRSVKSIEEDDEDFDEE